jgi:hypothetical protein
MNDSELDQMLNRWGAPPAGAELRERVSAAYQKTPKLHRRWRFMPVGWKGLFAGAAAAAVLFLLVCTQAFPDVLGSPSPALRPPYVAESKVTAYAADGSSRLESTIMSHSYKGTEIVQLETDQGNPLLESIKAFHIGVHQFLLRYVPNLVMPESSARDAWFSSYVNAGCVDKGDVVIGHDKVLSYRTTVVQSVSPDGWRWTGWLAPDLGCFALKSKSEQPLPGGGFRIAKIRETVRVLVRRSDGNGWQGHMVSN